MEIPNTAFVALGAIVAALLTGIFSFISLINQKEGKISEFRQSWIDSIRDDLSILLASIEKISTAWQLIEIEEEEKDKKYEGTEWIKRFHELTHEDGLRFSQVHQRILMRLNRNEHIELIDHLRQARNYISDTSLMYNKKDLRTKTDKILETSQDLLKKEWEVVKAGEKPYRTTKNATIVVVVTLMAVLGWSIYALSSQTRDSGVISNKSIQTTDTAAAD